jgi:multidrug efflux pump
MKNLTELSLKNRSLVWYFIVVVFIAGIFSYTKLGRMEDPDFTIRQMVVTVSWPGATAREMEEQVTDKIEKKLQDTTGLDYVKSYSRPGSSVIYVNLRQDVANSAVRTTWQEVRNLVNDMKTDLPSGVYGPYFNDRFDDVYGSIYALTGDGYSYEEMRDRAEKIRRLLLDVKSVKKVELVGEQTEKIYIEVERSKLAALGISPQAVSDAVKKQNTITPAGMVETESDNVYLRLTGPFDNIEAIRGLPIRANGKTFRLGDIAKVERRYSEPAEPKMFFNGEPAIGIAVSMESGGNILTLGDNLNNLISKVKTDLPAGLEIHPVSDQPQVVKESIGDFVDTLREAIIIVLVVSFLSLGIRTGLVVAGCIPLVIAGVFVGMEIMGISLHKVSLGALIISLGLLVDDAIIAVEMMSVKLEAGYGRFEAACYAFEATARPMLTGTLITCAGFIPVAFAKGMAAEFCQALFPVIGMALILSWIVSVMVAPLYGYKLIKVKVHKAEDGKIDPYQSKFYGFFRKILVFCLEHKALVLGVTAACFIASLFTFKVIKQEFFPPSLRPEIIVEMTLPEGSSLKSSEAEAQRFAQFLTAQGDSIKNYSYYVGEGAPRFVLTTEPMLPANNYVQFVVVAKDVDARKDLTTKINAELADAFPNVRSNLKFIQTGPPAAYPVMLRVEGYDHDKVREIANEVADKMSADSNLQQIHFDWNEKSKVMHLELDQDKLRNLGLTSQDLAQLLYTELSGNTVAQYYSGDRTIDIAFRLKDEDRSDLSKLADTPIYVGTAGYVPLGQIAKISYAAEDGLIWRRDLKPAITVSANIASGTANDAAQKAYDATSDIRANLPLGYSIKADGALADSKDSIDFLLIPVPVMLLLIATLLMLQLRSVQLMIMTLLTAPLGIIGVSFGMLLTNEAMGFVAELGILALSGMIIRNSVILIDQIQKHIAEGEDPWHAIIDSAVLRFRPIMLTAAAAILGMLPLVSSTFWGPMAVAIASGLLVATVLTLLVLPTMYAAWFKVKQ